jgi:hypothetical protein
MPSEAADPGITNPFTNPQKPDPPITLEEMFLRLGCAAAFGVLAGAAYFLTQRKKRAEAASFVSTLVLLSILLAMVSMVIGSNVARAFSLVGALSIVRFRTIVEDTRDTAFVIFAVVVGMAAGAGAYVVAAIGIPLVALSAWALTVWGQNGNGRAREGVASATTAERTTLVVRIGIGVDPDGALAQAIEKLAESVWMVSVATARQGAALDLTYRMRPREGVTPVALVGELNKLEGVQSVEWKETPDDDSD